MHISHVLRTLYRQMKPAPETNFYMCLLFVCLFKLNCTFSYEKFNNSNVVGSSQANE